MKKLIPLIALLFLFGCASVPTKAVKTKDWKGTTPMGIKLKANAEAIAQYEAKYGPWANINWSRVDQGFVAYQNFFQGKPKAKKLTVVIAPWNEPCIDCIYGHYPDCVYPRGAAIPSSWGCVQGLFLYPTTIKLHLGKDSGQGPNGFCATAMFHELNHWAMMQSGNPCWQSEGGGNCMQFWPSEKSLGLCP